MSPLLFTPVAGDEISYRGEICTFIQHPGAAEGKALCEAGKRAKVYPLRVNGEIKYAIKVFKPLFRTQEIYKKDIEIQMLLRNKYQSHLPPNNHHNIGLTVAKRGVINQIEDSNLIQEQPGLEYCIVMPWVNGDKWSDYLITQKSLSKKQCMTLARNICSVLVNLEEKKLAHCDISGENLIFQWDPERESYKIELIDIEEIYGPGLSVPTTLPAGSPGYSPEWIKTGLWSEAADRFATGILLSQIVGWQSEIVRETRYERTFFDPLEVGKECKRFKVLHDEVKKINRKLSLLLSQVWFSTDISECPSLHEWQEALCEGSEDQQFDPKIVADQCQNTKTFSEMASNGEFLKQVTQNRQANWEKSLAFERIQYTDTQVSAIIQVWMKEMGVEVVPDWLTCECGQKQKNEEIYCQQCGRQILPDRICPHCKSSTPANSARCRKCGKKIGGFF